MRKNIIVKKVFQRQEHTGEDAILFKDLNGNRYVWFTKSITTKITFVKENEIISKSADIIGESDIGTIIKNVRLIKGSCRQ